MIHFAKDMPNYFYQIYQFTLKSDFPIPEMIEIEPKMTDLFVKQGKVPDRLGNVLKEGDDSDGFIHCQLNDDEILLTIRGVGKFYIAGQKNIVVEGYSETPWEEVRHYFLGCCLGALNVKNGFFALHGSAVQIGNSCIIFTGPSGVGKSTLAATFLAEGYDLLADDMCVIRLDDSGTPWVYPAEPRIRIWEDSSLVLGYEPGELEKLSPRWEKFVMTPKIQFARDPMPLKAIYALHPIDSGELEIIDLKGFEKIRVLLVNTLVMPVMVMLNLESQHLFFCSKLLESVELKKINRPKSRFELKELLSLIESDYGH